MTETGLIFKVKFKLFCSTGLNAKKYTLLQGGGRCKSFLKTSQQL